MKLPTSYAFPGGCSLKKQVDVLETDIIYVGNRIRGLEDLLDNPDIEPDMRDAIELEIITMRQQIQTHKKTVKGFHSDKQQRVYIITCFIFIIFMVFGLYRIFYM